MHEETTEVVVGEVSGAIEMPQVWSYSFNNIASESSNSTLMAGMSEQYVPKNAGTVQAITSSLQTFEYNDGIILSRKMVITFFW